MILLYLDIYIDHFLLFPLLIEKTSNRNVSNSDIISVIVINM